MKTLEFGLLSLFVCFSVAHADPTTDQIHDAASQIASALKSHLVPLDRTTMTFHYINQTEEPRISSKQQIADWAGSTAEQFWNLDAYSSDVQGVGFYAAVDPSASRPYGGDRPVLFAIPIKKGTTILNMLSAQPEDENNFLNLKNLAHQIRCVEGQHNYEMFNLEGITQLFRNSDQKFCREIIVDAYRQLGVQAILYSFPANEFVFGCRYREGAFNLINASAIDVEGSALFWNTGSFANRTLARLISQNYRYSREEFYTRYADIVFPQTKFKIPGSLEGLDTFERSAQSWRKRNLLSCGPSWSTEGHEPKINGLNASLRTGFSDLEIEDADIDWHKAYQARLPVKIFDVDAILRIAAIEKLVYLQTGLPKDFSRFDDWKRASDYYHSNELTEQERDQKVGQLLGEPVPNLNRDETIAILQREIGKLYDSSHLQPGLYGNILRSMGYGPLLIRLKITEMVSFFGGMPVVATQVPMDASVNGIAFFTANKAAFLQILRTCTLMMNDNSISIEKIQASECGVRPKPETKL